MKLELAITPALHARLVFEAERRGTHIELLAVEALVRALADSAGMRAILDEGVPIEKLR